MFFLVERNGFAIKLKKKNVHEFKVVTEFSQTELSNSF